MTDENLTLELMINNVRCSRLSITSPFIGRNAKIDPNTGKPVGNYHADLILEPTDPQVDKIKALMRAAIVKKFGDKAPVVIEQIAASNKLAIHRGDIDRAGKPEYAGKLYLSASNPDQPTIVVTENGENIANRGTPKVLAPTHPLYPWSGCYVNAHVRFNAYDHPTGGKGVSCYLLGLQFAGRGERLGGSSVSSASAFGIVAATADAPAPTAAPAVASSGLI